MKKILLVALVAMLSTTAAFADGGHGWGHGGGWGRGGGWGVGWVAPALIGGVLAYDLANPYPYPYPYYAQPAPVYVQSYSTPVLATPAAQYWYFCRSANGYYPYVPSCAEGWQTVPMTPPR